MNILVFNTKSSVEFIIIFSILEFVSDTNYIFCNYYYTFFYINWEFLNKKQEMCINANYIIIMTDRAFIPVIIKIKKIIISISIRDLKSKIYYFDKYVIFIFYIKSVLSNNKNIRVFV